MARVVTTAVYSDEQLAEALRLADFKVAPAARQLGMTADKLNYALKKREGLATLVEEYRVYRVTRAEVKCAEMVEKGHWPSIAMTLGRLGKKEGWGDTIAIESGVDAEAIADAVRRRYPPTPNIIEIPSTVDAIDATDAIEVDT